MHHAASRPFGIFGLDLMTRFQTRNLLLLLLFTIFASASSAPSDLSITLDLLKVRASRWIGLDHPLCFQKKQDELRHAFHGAPSIASSLRRFVASRSNGADRSRSHDSIPTGGATLNAPGEASEAERPKRSERPKRNDRFANRFDEPLSVWSKRSIGFFEKSTWKRTKTVSALL